MEDLFCLKQDAILWIASLHHLVGQYGFASLSDATQGLRNQDFQSLLHE